MPHVSAVLEGLAVNVSYALLLFFRVLAGEMGELCEG